jgi:hypothetical protein
VHMMEVLFFASHSRCQTAYRRSRFGLWQTRPQNT